jgi:hypothetical protein
MRRQKFGDRSIQLVRELLSHGLAEPLSDLSLRRFPTGNGGLETGVPLLRQRQHAFSAVGTGNVSDQTIPLEWLEPAA